MTTDTRPPTVKNVIAVEKALDNLRAAIGVCDESTLRVVFARARQEAIESRHSLVDKIMVNLVRTNCEIE